MTKNKSAQNAQCGTLGSQHQMFQFYKSISTILNSLLMWADLSGCCIFSNSCPLKLADTEETWPMYRTEEKLVDALVSYLNVVENAVGLFIVTAQTLAKRQLKP